MSTKLVRKQSKVPDREEILKKLNLDRERLEHTLRVEKIALKLGERWGGNKKKIRLAALLHDCARRYQRGKLLKVARKIGLEIDPVRRFEPKLFHAEIGAYLAKKEFGVKSPEVLRA
ncbi:MAG: bis(5'-nucleosyl)-tetraphosphatase (symmetrical) YqeK, partial [Candidatus Margulisiibacteriota bacterium]